MTPMPVLFVTFAALLSANMPAFADGTVLRAKGCGDKVFVATENAYSVLRATELGAADDGDKLVGNTDRLGFSSFFIPQSGRRVWQQDLRQHGSGLRGAGAAGRRPCVCRRYTDRRFQPGRARDRQGSPDRRGAHCLR